MDPLRVSFIILIAASVLLGGVVAADVGTNLRNIDAAGTIKERVDVSVAEVELREESFVARVQLRNPTGADLRVTGARLRVFNDSNARLASGAGSRLDDNGERLPGGGTLRATYAITVSDAQRGLVRSALGQGATLSLNVAMNLGDTKFVVRTAADVGEGA